MESISIVIWTFTVSFITFYFNNNKSMICGISYEQVFIILEEKCCFLKRKQQESNLYKIIRRLLSTSLFRILILQIIVVLGGTAFCNYTKDYVGMFIIVVYQIILLNIFIVALLHIMRANRIEKEIQRRINEKFIVYNIVTRDLICSNWGKLIVKDSFEKAHYTADELHTLNCWLYAIEEKISMKFEKERDFEVKMYQVIYKTILVNDERFQNRWDFILNSVFNKGHNRLVEKMKAITFLLLENADTYDEKYLYKFLEKCNILVEKMNMASKEERREADMYVWAAAYNYYRCRETNEEWRRIFYREIYERVANAYNYQKNEVEKQLGNEITMVERYHKIIINEVVGE